MSAAEIQSQRSQTLKGNLISQNRPRNFIFFSATATHVFDKNIEGKSSFSSILSSISLWKITKYNKQNTYKVGPYHF